MDKFQYKRHIVNTAAIGAGIVFIIIVLLFVVLIKPNTVKFNKLVKEIKLLRIKMSDYTNFEITAKKYEEKKKEIKESIALFYSNVISREEIDKKFLEEISNITKDAKVEIEKIVPVGASSRAESGYEKRVWKISFISNYNGLIKFIDLLENNKIIFGIEKMEILSGKNTNAHSIDLYMYTVIPNMEKINNTNISYDISRSTNVFSVPDKTYRILEEVSNIRSGDKKVMLSTKNDPMYYLDTIFSEKKKKAEDMKKKNIHPRPNLNLEGIIWDPQKPMVIINGEVLGKGQMIKGVKIIDISRTGVTVKWQSSTYELKLKQ